MSILLDRVEVAAPRRFVVAALLSLLMPGLGHVYCGQVRAGLTIWGVVLAAWGFCLLVWTRWIFAPLLPALVLCLAWGALQAVLVGDLWRLVRALGPGYRRGPINHGVAYVSVFLGLGVLPVGASLVFVARTQVGSVEVRSAAMFPHLLPGDRVLFDRTAYADEPPAVGALVVVEGSGGPMVVRVVAVAGQTVHLRDGRLVVDGQRLHQGPLERLQVPRFGGEEAARLAELEGFLEDNHGRRYVVTYDRGRSVRLRLEPPPEVLKPGELYVVGDNRDAAVEDRWHGRVRQEAVLGQPRCIWASHDGRGVVRGGRAGLDLRLDLR